MDISSVKIELRLIYSKICNRVKVGNELSNTMWNPKLVDLPPGKRVLVLSPHPDDDAIGLGGTIIKLRESAADVRVVYLFLPASDVETYKIRREEGMQSLKVMGVDNFSFPVGEAPSPGLLRDLIIKEMREYHPDLVFVPSPLENHNEHLATFTAYVEALRSVDEVDTALYEVWGVVVPNMAVDISPQADRKDRAIAVHASQTRLVDYVSMARALNKYRAISFNHQGQVEAFLYLNRKEMLRLFTKR